MKHRKRHPIAEAGERLFKRLAGAAWLQGVALVLPPLADEPTLQVLLHRELTYAEGLALEAQGLGDRWEGFPLDFFVSGAEPAVV